MLIFDRHVHPEELGDGVLLWRVELGQYRALVTRYERASDRKTRFKWGVEVRRDYGPGWERLESGLGLPTKEAARKAVERSVRLFFNCDYSLAKGRIAALEETKGHIEAAKEGKVIRIGSTVWERLGESV